MNYKGKSVRLFVRLLSCLLILAFAIGSIGAQDEPRVLRIASTAEPPVLVDYLSISGLAWAANRIYALASWGMDESGSLIPLLVDEVPSLENGGIEHTAEGKTITRFRIADWAVWSDGTPITAADFVLVFDIMTDELTNRHQARFVSGLGVDSLTQGETEKDVVITFSGFNPAVIDAAITPLPNHVLRDLYEEALASGQGFDTLTDWVRAPSVANGPFVFAEWVSGSLLRFQKNENFWREVWFDELVINFYPDANVVRQIMANGEADFTTSISDPLQAAELVADNPQLELQTSFAGTRQELYMNVGPSGNPALKDVRVREAIAMAINRESIANDLFEGYTKVPRSYWDDTPYFNPNLEFTAFDPAAAAALMREAGWYDDDGDGIIEAHGVEGVEDGMPLTLRALSFSDAWGGPYSASMLVIQSDLNAFGIEVDVQLLPFATVSGTYDEGGLTRTGQYDLLVTAWGVGTDSVAQVNHWACNEIPGPDVPGGTNEMFYCNEEVDQLWEVLKSSLDENEVTEAVYRIQEILQEEMPTIFIVNLPSVAVMSANLENVERAPGTTQLYYNLDEWKFAN